MTALTFLLAAGLSQAEGQGLGLISLVLAIICALAYLIVQALFQAGGIQTNISPQAIN